MVFSEKFRSAGVSSFPFAENRAAALLAIQQILRRLARDLRWPGQPGRRSTTDLSMVIARRKAISPAPSGRASAALGHSPGLALLICQTLEAARQTMVSRSATAGATAPTRRPRKPGPQRQRGSPQDHLPLTRTACAPNETPPKTIRGRGPEPAASLQGTDSRGRAEEIERDYMSA